MPFEIVRNDITNMYVDAIVNTANPRPVVGSGTDAGIHAKAGPELLEARKKIGNIRVGEAAVTPGFALPAKCVIHTVGPMWRGGFLGEERKLRRCYDSALKLALENGCQSVAFPLISAGNYGFPKDKALRTAISAFSDFLMEHEMQIYLVVFHRDVFQLSEKLFQSVASYIDENYVEEKTAAEYGGVFAPEERFDFSARWDMPEEEDSFPRTLTGEEALEFCRTVIDAETEYLLPEAADYEATAPMASMPPAPPVQAPPPVEMSRKCSAAAVSPKSALSLDEMLANIDAGFTETLLKLIDKTGKKDSEIYKKANLSKQHFSKIRNNPNYKPTKQTALALALALELDLETTKDLIGRAGYALSNSSKFDLIIRYFIEQGKYNVVEINIALYEFDQSLLGN